MATEVESAWSPAKRFTLVKPTFKGIESQKLTRGYSQDSFGKCTAVSDDGNTFVATSYRNDGVNQTQYVCNVFEKTEQYFNLSHILVSPESSQSGQVSEQNVSISGDGNTIALGLFGSMGQGVVSVFTRIGTTWEHQALLTPTVQKNGLHFGAAVSLNHDGTVCGIGTSDMSAAYSPGSAYVFVKSGGVWSQQTKIDPPDGIHGGYFGRFLSISGDGNTLAVSAIGSVNMPYIYVRSGSDWNLQSRLVLDGGYGISAVGWNITLSSDGNTCGFLASTVDTGLFLFERTGSTWAQTAKILNGSNVYSSHMSRDGKTCIIGLIYGPGGAGTMNGKALVSVKSNGVWKSPIELMPVDGMRDESFGHPVLLNGDGTTAFIGTYSNMAGHIDAIYIFV